jgi:hypothetical protein
MRWLIVIIMSGAAFLLAREAVLGSNQPPAATAVYTLYRDSPAFAMRIHVATFDAADGRDYNHYNCEIIRDLAANRPGIMVRYWCEPGRWRQ